VDCKLQCGGGGGGGFALWVGGLVVENFSPV